METGSSINPSVSPEDIVTYYDDCEIDYRWLWYLNDESAMHYGFWKEGTKDLGEALQNMNAFVINNLEIQDGDHILDAGCGVGGTARFVGQHYNAHVHGITLSENQVNKARQNAEKAGLEDRLTFSVRDYTNTQFPTEHFNGIYAIESVCHATEKADFLNESFRLLKPGGRLVVGGFFMNGEMKTESDARLMANWADTWAVPAFEPSDEFIRKAKEVGFEVEEEHEITDKIMRSALRLYRCFFLGITVHHILRLLRFRNKVQEKNVWSTYYQYKSLKKELWKYRVFKFKKAN